MAYLIPEHWGGILKSVVDENVPSGHIYVTPQLLENNEGAFVSALKAEMNAAMRDFRHEVNGPWIGAPDYPARWAREGIVVSV